MVNYLRSIGVVMSTSGSTRENIKSAAQDVFRSRGYDGARMQEIADRAGANKAMIYYYFRSKDELFEAIIGEAFRDLFALLSELWSQPIEDLQQILPRIIHVHLQFLAHHPDIPPMLVREIHSGNPIVLRVMKKVLSEFKLVGFDRLVQTVATAGRNGQIRPVDAEQTIWNIIALNLFHFITRPILSAVWPDTWKDETQLIKRREKAVVDLLLYGLLPREGDSGESGQRLEKKR